jgi:D-alanine-D-alanine ligase
MFNALGKRIGVFYGGPSSEHDVSIESARAILNQFPKGFYPIPIYVTKERNWIFNDILLEPENVLHSIDLALNAMHGEYGEDGEIQEIWEKFQIPYTGSRPFPSRLAMNKALTKEFLKKEGINTPVYKVIKKDTLSSKELLEIFRSLPLPVIIKPLSLGSSVGISLADNFFDFEAGLNYVFGLTNMALIEEYIQGREATCAVLENWQGERVRALLPVEIIPPPHKKFFDYEAKYTGISQEKCPGDFTDEEAKKIMDMSERAHKALGLRHYSRSDFIIHPTRGIFFIEVNTLPGLTNESLLPKSLATYGYSLTWFIEHIINLAFNN